MNIQREQELFEYLKKYFPDLTFSIKKFSKWDCYSPQHKYRIELKCRQTHYRELVIEKAKYEALINKCKPHGDKPVYICSTPRGVWAFKLDELDEPRWFKKRMPRTTHFNRRDFIEKEVGMIPVNKGKKI